MCHQKEAMKRNMLINCYYRKLFVCAFWTNVIIIYALGNQTCTNVVIVTFMNVIYYNIKQLFHKTPLHQYKQKSGISNL